MSGAGGTAGRDGAAAGEQAFYDRIASRFWDPNGPMQALHTINPMRADWIEARAARFGPALAGARVLDVGCAVGLLSEALARRGATVTGIDVSERNVEAARRHASGGGLSIEYRAGTLGEAVPGDERYDVVCCLEVVEHVGDLEGFLAALARRVRPGGLLFVSSIARTPESLAFAKIGAEYLLRVLPPGTHRWSDFRNPDEIKAGLARHGMSELERTGMGYLPVLDRAWWRASTRINWMAVWRASSG